MKVIVGLGNPGKNFELTRHNLGFEFVERLAKELQFDSFKEKDNGMLSSGFYQGVKVILLKSRTFMNDSGEAVAHFMNYYKVASTELLVIYDDITLPLTKVRLRTQGSSGGHNGIKSIIRELKSDQFSRIKVGIGHDQSVPLDQWVVGRFSVHELQQLSTVYKEVSQIISVWLLKKDAN